MLKFAPEVTNDQSASLQDKVIHFRKQPHGASGEFRFYNMGLDICCIKEQLCCVMVQNSLCHDTIQLLLTLSKKSQITSMPWAQK